MSDSDSDWSLPDSTSKKCQRCKKTKPYAQFNFGRKSLYTNNCTDCCAYDTATSVAFAKTAAGKQVKKKYNKTDKATAARQRHRSKDLFVQTTAAYRSSARYKQLREAEYERTHSDPGRHLEHAIGVTISRMIKGKAKHSKKVRATLGVSSRYELVAHFQQSFEPGMTLENHGKYEVGKPRRWNVGHRIARFHFNPNEEEDMKRCWCLDNLFAQWADENVKANIKLPSEAELLRLKHCWPTAWGA